VKGKGGETWAEQERRGELRSMLVDLLTAESLVVQLQCNRIQAGRFTRADLLETEAWLRALANRVRHIADEWEGEHAS
jgi:hypothetical protein